MSPVRVFHDRRSTRTDAFTLIELLVVIFIIGILIATVLTVVPKVKRAVYGAETQAQLSALSNAIQQYYNDFKSYPGPLPNNQLNMAGDNSGLGAYITDPLSTTIPPATLALGYVTPTGFTNSNYVPTNMNTYGRGVITSSQNLVLGLLGGLEYVSNGDTFVYNPQDIFSDGQTPAPRGPASLNASNPRRQQAYIQVKPGEISIPSLAYNGGSGGSFQDEALRSPLDAMIPVFLDKYSNPMPILYYRTNIGGSAIVGNRSQGVYCDDNGATLTNPPGAGSTSPALTPQYDLMQNRPYVRSRIGTIAQNPNSFHGLQGITNTSNAAGELLISQASPPTPPVDSIDSIINGQSVPTNSGANGLAYFKDPTLNSTTFDGSATAPSNVNLGVARQKDGYVLISAGPDRLYGTHDDVIFPGPLQP